MITSPQLPPFMFKANGGSYEKVLDYVSRFADCLDNDIDGLWSAATAFRFVKVGATEKERFTCILTDELIIGRDNAATFSFPEDDLLSTRHCRIVRNGIGFGVEDLNSTNGTYLNGVPVQQMRTIEKDDVLLIGSMELRVTWD